MNKFIYENYVKLKLPKFTTTLNETFNIDINSLYDSEIIENIHYLYFKNRCNFDFYFFINLARYIKKINSDCTYIIQFILENFYNNPYAIIYNNCLYLCDYDNSYIFESIDDKVLFELNNKGIVIYDI